jgi:hypothetical protein
MVRDMTAVVAAANRGIGYEGSMVRDDPDPSRGVWLDDDFFGSFSF